MKKNLRLKGFVFSLVGVLILTMGFSSPSFSMGKHMSCIFCDIAAKRAPAFIFWENEQYLAFLSIFPNTEGVSVVIPRAHYASNIWKLPEGVRQGLVSAAAEVNQHLCDRLGVARCAMVWEGYGVDHAHAKLFPLHGTQTEGAWQPISSNIQKTFQNYEGYISSHDGPRASDAILEAVYQKLR